MVGPKWSTNPIAPLRSRFRRPVALPLALVFAFVTITAPMSGCAPIPRSAARSRATAPAPRKPTGAEVFSGQMTSLTRALDAARGSLAKGSLDATALAAVEAFSGKLSTLDSGVRSDFAKTRGILAKVHSPAKDAIERKVEAQYAAREAELSNCLAAVSDTRGSDERLAAIRSLAAFVASVTPKQAYQPLGTQLPHRVVNLHAGPPVLGTSVSPAYAPSMPGALPSSLPRSPTAADLTQTVEVRFTPEITSLVASLGADPVRMYEYVRNTIDFEPYYGSRKGAAETLAEGSGNDIDTASLLIALYRASGIPARYVSGVVELSAPSAEKWLGVETVEDAARLLSAAGVPTRLVYSGGRATSLQFEHTWTEVFLADEDYRGAGQRRGPSDWMPLDASYKSYLPDCAGLKPWESSLSPALASAVMQSFEESGGGVVIPTGLRSSLASSIDLLTLSTTSAVAAVPATDLASVRVPRTRQAALLPSSPPARIVSVDGEWELVPKGLEESYRISLSDSSGGQLIDVTLTSAEIAGGPLAVEYIPASQEDASIVQGAGDLAASAAYLVGVKPVLVLRDTAVATGEAAVYMGSDTTLKVISMSTGALIGHSDAAAGGAQGLVFDWGREAPGEIAVNAAQLDGNLQTFAGQGVQGAMPAAGQVLAQATSFFGQDYFDRVDSQTRRIARFMGVRWVRGTSYATVTLGLNSIGVLGTAMAVGYGGASLDVSSLCQTVLVQDAQRRNAFLALAGGISSELEGSALTDLSGGGPGVSTEEVINTALQEGIPLVEVDASTESRLDELPVSRSVVDSLRNAVHSGLTVVVPSSEVTVGPWVGSAWIVSDPSSGSQGYMIAGNLAGGWWKQPLFNSVLTAAIAKILPSGIWVNSFQAAVTAGSVFSMLGDVRDMETKRAQLNDMAANVMGAKPVEVYQMNQDIATNEQVVLGSCMAYASIMVVQPGGVGIASFAAVASLLSAEMVAYDTYVTELEIECVEQDLSHQPIRQM